MCPTLLLQGYLVSANQDPNFYLQKLVRLQKRVLLDESDEEGKDNNQYNSAIFSPLFSPLPVKVKQTTK
jgi:hypothetical protein